MILGHPRSKAPARLGVICSSPGPSNNNSRASETDSRDPETGNLETEKRVHRIHGALETGLYMLPRILVAPATGAGALIG